MFTTIEGGFMKAIKIEKNPKKEIKAYSKMAVRLILGIIICLPVIFAVMFSFESNENIGIGVISLVPKDFTFDNYVYVLKNTPVFTYLKNTFIMLIVCIPARVMLGAMAAYGFAFFKFKGNNLLFTLFIIAMMIPGEVIIMTHYVMIQEWNMYDTYVGLTITGLVDISTMFMLRQNMLSMPKSLREAAFLDGCGDIYYFFKIALPLCKIVIVAQVLTTFISVYNSYLWPLLVTSTDDMRTIQTGVANLMRDSERNLGSVLAGSVLSMIIPGVVYVFGTKQITEGLTAGSVKG